LELLFFTPSRLVVAPQDGTGLSPSEEEGG
jgi:hypothetical protein